MPDGGEHALDWIGAEGCGRALDEKARQQPLRQKNHINVDSLHKLVRRYHVTGVGVHDSQAMEHLLIRDNIGSGVWANVKIGMKNLTYNMRCLCQLRCINPS